MRDRVADLLGATTLRLVSPLVAFGVPRRHQIFWGRDGLRFSDRQPQEPQEPEEPRKFHWDGNSLQFHEISILISDRAVGIGPL